MAEISANLVKTLREKTGAGMMDCKKALNEVGGDLEVAVDWLRKKGLAAAAKKSGRVAAEGLVGVASLGTRAAVLEVNAETDFIARNGDFQNLVSQAVHLAAGNQCDVESLKATNLANSAGTVQDEITRLISIIGENIALRRVDYLSVSKGLVASYIHSAIAPNLGRIGVIVALESEGDASKLADLGKKLAMHIAAAQPHCLAVSEVDPVKLERERAVLIEQARASGRPEDVIQKMVEGRVKKFFEEIVLLEQTFVVDGKTRIADVLENTSREIGCPVSLTGFKCFVLGDGIQREHTDFAAEVQAQAGLVS